MRKPYNSMMVRWIANNIGLMLLAIALAFAVWVISAWQEDPILEDNISARVVVSGLEQSNGLVLASTLPTSITTRIRAPRSVWQKLSANGIQVNLNLRAYDAGTHAIELNPTLSQQPASVVSSTPITAVIKLERLATLTLPVTLNLFGEPSIGFRALAPIISPVHITITAPQQLISTVVELVGSVSVDGARSNVEQAVSITARDAAGNTVSGVLVEPGVVRVRVPLEQLSNYKDLAVRVRTQGQPSGGYNIASVSSDPQIVTVFGSREAIEALPGFIETQAVEINNATSDVEERVNLSTPPNVSPLTTLQVTVKIKIEPIQGARTVSRKIEVIGLSQSLESVLSPLTVDIVLGGSLPRLTSLNEGDVKVIIDAKDLKLGTNQVTPQITVPDGITVQSVQPATIQVELSATSKP